MLGRLQDGRDYIMKMGLHHEKGTTIYSSMHTLWRGCGLWKGTSGSDMQ